MQTKESDWDRNSLETIEPNTPPTTAPSGEPQRRGGILLGRSAGAKNCLIAALILIALRLACDAAQAQTCELYPLAVSAESLAGVAAGDILPDLFNGTTPGNFGWLSWSGSPSTPALVRSLTPPGDSRSYVNPDNHRDHELSPGDWVSAKPGVSNSKNVRDALDALKSRDMLVAVWDQARGHGEKAAYRVAGFIRVRLLDYRLPQQNRITARFLGGADCGTANSPPVVNAGEDQTITLPASAALQGQAMDDGLPDGGALTTTWSKSSGPGAVTFADAHAAATAVSFDQAGTYVLRLSASDSALAAYDDVTITVNHQNRAPAAPDLAVATDEDTPVAVTLAGVDPDGDALFYIIVASPNYGVLSGTPPELVYTPKPDYNGPDHFTFKVSDGQLDSPLATVSIINRPINDPPAADGHSLTNYEDTPAALSLSGSDVEGASLTYRITSVPTRGTLVGVTPDLVYQPDPNFAGADQFQFVVNDGELDSAPATVTLQVISVNDIPDVEAGADQIITWPAREVSLKGHVTDDNFYLTNSLLVNWSVVTGPGGVEFGDPFARETTATVFAPGTYRLRLTASDLLLTSSDELTVTVNAPPVADAGAHLVLTYPEGGLLSGQITDDGLPAGAEVTAAWSKVSGPGSVHFAEVNQASTAVTFSESGVYVLRLTADDSLASTTDDITVTVNRAPAVDAGPDQLVNFPNAATLAGTVSDDGLPAGADLETSWIKVSGPGDVEFSSAAANATAAFNAPGVYVLRLAASDSIATCSDEVTISVNAAPVVWAGEPQTIFIDGGLVLQGTAADDGLPAGIPLETRWTVVEGPGSVAIDDVYALAPRVAFSAPGQYVFRLTASDSLLLSSSDVTITVRPVNQPPAVFAGTNQIVQFPAVASLRGVVTDDGEPAGHPLTVLWAKVSGPGSVVFADAVALETTVAFDAPGLYQLRLTASDSELAGCGDVVVIVNQAPVVNAGSDVVTAVSNLVTLRGEATDDGLPFGTLKISWSQVSGPGLALLAQPGHAVCDVRFAAPGVYLLRLSATDSNAVASDDVMVTVRPAGDNLPPVVNAGTNQYVALTNRVLLAGSVMDDGLPWESPVTAQWSVVSGSGEVSFEPAHEPMTWACFSAAGVYVLQLAANDTEFTTVAEVTVAIYQDNQPPVVDAGADVSIASGPATLRGVVLDDGRPTGDALQFRWSMVSGVGEVFMADPSNAVITVTFSAAGDYVFRLTASDGEWCASDEVIVTVTGNQAPVVNAGPDQVLELVVPTGGAAASTVWCPLVPDEWRYPVSQPGLNGAYGAFLYPRVLRNGMAVSGAELYVSGSFLNAGSNEVRSLARWNGCHWSALYDPRPSNPTNPASPPVGFIGYSGVVAPVAVRGHEVFVGGGFLRDLGNDGHLDLTARWTGTNWERWEFKTLKSTIAARALLVTSNAVYFSGDFIGQPLEATPGNRTPVTGVPIVYNVIKWNGTNWEAMGEGIRDMRDTSSMTYAIVNALAVAPNGDIVAGGNFVMQTPFGLATNLARWDGVQWAPIGPVSLTGCGGYNCRTEINALTYAANGDLFAGGNFTQAGTVAANYVARWDGTDWCSLGNGFNAAVQALAFRGVDLYAGGDFTSSGTRTCMFLARWDGTSWQSVSNGVNGTVAALAVTPSGLYAGGGFDRAEGQVANRIAKWGRNERPTVTGPEPVLVQNAPEGGATVPVTIVVKHPCGSALTVAWNVDGGSAETTDLLPEGSTATPQGVVFTHHYSPGVHSLDVSCEDGQGGLVIFSTTVTVLTPATTTLSGNVSDDGLPGGELISTWSQIAGPVATSLAVATFTDAPPITQASFHAVGTYVLRLSADDSEFLAGDEVTVHVRAAGTPNTPPAVHVFTDQPRISLGDTAYLEAVALDDAAPGGALTLEWGQVGGPGETWFTPTNRIVGVPSAVSVPVQVQFSLPGTYVLYCTASDSEFSAFEEIVITVVAETNRPPAVLAGSDRTINLDTELELAGEVTDDGLPFGTTIANWSQVSGSGVALFRIQNGKTYAVFGAVGEYVLRLEANDGKLSASDDVIVTVLNNPTGPFVQIHSSEDTVTLTAPTEIVGTVGSDILQSWTLEYRLKPAEDESGHELSAIGNSPWLPLATGAVAVADAPLGTFDPTLLLNGLYEVRLTAVDTVGRTATTPPLNVLVDRNLKVGHFTVSFSDLAMPLAGIPIEVVRTYDSRDKRVGDFGVGWALGLRNVRLQKNRTLGNQWQELGSGGALGSYFLDCRRPRLVTLTFPNGRVEKFQAVPVPAGQFGIPIVAATITYVPLDNTRGSLASATGDEVLVGGSIPGLVDLLNYQGGLYNPRLFRYTTPAGEEYLIDEAAGLKSLTDCNGNSLTIDADGLHHSSGQSVQFVRDELGRITNIVDAAGHAMTYQYDVRGDLVTFVDRENHTNSFEYNARHELLTLVDALGVAAARNEYDSAGRLIVQTDAQGRRSGFFHDLAGRREFTTNRLGHVTLQEYDDNGNVTRMVDALGATTILAYDGNDNLVLRIDPLGRTNRFAYDEFDNRISATDPLGHTVRLSYNAQRLLTGLTDALGHVTTNFYDARGNLLATRDPSGHTTAFGYDPRGLLVAMTNALGHVTRYQHDASGQVTNVVNALGHALGYQRDAQGNPIGQTTTRTLANGAVEILSVRAEYDLLNRPTNTIYPDGSRVSVELNAAGQTVAHVDPLGRRTRFEYDEAGRLTRTIAPDGLTNSVRFDAEGRTTAVTDRLGQTTQFGYDALGRLQRVDLPDGASITNYFDLAGQRVAVTDARGFTTFFGYDDAGRRVALTNALGQVSRAEFDANGNLSATIDALGRRTEFAYDATRQLTNTVFADGSSIAVVFDALGRRRAQMDRAGRTTSFGFDALGQLTSVTNALGHVTRYGYDELGHLLRQTDANLHTTTFEYDVLGRPVSRTLPGGQSEFFAYDAAGNLTSRTDFNGNTTIQVYDVMDRLVERIPDPRRGEPSVTYAYDALGRRTNMVDAAGATRYRYDVRNRLMEKIRTWASAGVVAALAYAYDANSNVTNVQSSNLNGAFVSYAYDPLNRLAEVNDHRVGRTEYGYDDLGNLSRVTGPNGVSTLYGYDALNRLTNVSTATLLAPLANYSYQLGAAGHRVAATEALAGFDAQPSLLNRIFQYDATYRLTSETIQSPAPPASLPPVAALDYTYDPVGNRLTRASTLPGLGSAAHAFDANDRLSSDSYDANGNTTAAALQPPLTGVSYTVADRYDFDDRLVERRTARDGQAATIDFAYDGDGQRVAKTVNGRTTFFVVDDLNPTGYAQVLEELNAVGGPADFAVTRTYTHGHTLLSQDQLLDGQWATSFYGYDGQHSVRYLTDLAGRVTDTQDYDAFGNLIARASAGAAPTPNVYGYRGQQYDPDLDLHYLRARYHNPGTGRFWSMDAFGGFADDPASLHKYTYAGNDPINAWDPSGHWTLVEAQMTTAIASTINAMAFGFGVETVLVGQANLAEAGYSSSAVLDAIEVLLWFRLASDLYASANIARAAPTLLRAAGRSVMKAFDVLRQLSPRDWVRMKAFGPKSVGISAAFVEDILYCGDDFLLSGTTKVSRNVPRMNMVTEAAKETFVTPGQYDGVRQLSQMLRDAGVPRQARLEVINSFQPGTIISRTAMGGENVIRFHSGGVPPLVGTASQPLGRFVTPTFPASGDAITGLALPNFPGGVTQFSLRQGARFFEGTVAPNFGKSGGGVQYFLPNLSDLIP